MWTEVAHSIIDAVCSHPSYTAPSNYRSGPGSVQTYPIDWVSSFIDARDCDIVRIVPYKHWLMRPNSPRAGEAEFAGNLIRCPKFGYNTDSNVNCRIERSPFARKCRLCAKKCHPKFWREILTFFTFLARELLFFRQTPCLVNYFLDRPLSKWSTIFRQTPGDFRLAARTH